MQNLFFINLYYVNMDVICVFILFKHKCCAHCLYVNVICYLYCFNMNVVCLFMLFKHKNHILYFHI